ncbi:MAG TPA: hypothetical protein VGG76_01585 [Gemmatimonadaceae bacterium]
MNSHKKPGLGIALAVAAILVLSSNPILAQNAPRRNLGRDSAVVIPGEIYRAGGLHRELLGNNHRDAWTTPVKVPILDLASFHGGLKPTKTGGGAQTQSLRFTAGDGSEWVFRSVKKAFRILPKQYNHTVVWYIVRDQGSASHPYGALAVAPMESVLDVLHPSPTVALMPDDPRLGEFRQEFAGMLGELEERPETPKNGPAFAGASAIIGADSLLKLIDEDPSNIVDSRALLTARELDMLIGDNDRHPDQWKWARFGKTDTSPWEPVAVDRDKAFVSYEGLLMAFARRAIPSLVTFSTKYPDPQNLFANAGEGDRRLLQSLDKSVWDSIATSLMQRITDPVIDNAVASLPPEVARNSAKLAATLKARRNGLRGEADRYYGELWRVADVHGTDADDQATVTRAGEGIVDVVIQSGNAAPYFSRRFYLAETKQIRIYLHDGNDRATVQGSVGKSIKVRIIGGNGTNTFTDLSTVGGHRNPTHFYDAGTVNDVVYKPDTIAEKANVDMALNLSFNRRPWLRNYGTLIPPQQDRGSSIVPSGAVHSQRLLGIYPEVGVTKYNYGFRDVPYASMLQAKFAYSFASNRLRLRTAFDKRLEESDVHLPVTASVSQFEVVQFHGFGNDVPDLRGPLYDVHQRQWQFNPAIGRSFNPVSDLALGPVVRYTTTDSVANRLISQLRPYGFAKFGQAGLQLKGHLESRAYADTLKPRFVLDLTGDSYPGMWDLARPYQSLDAWAASFFTFNVPKKPVLALRVGGKKLWGPFPYFDAAFLGGSETFRIEERQRYAGDASLYGTTELRVPLARFPFIMPLDVGALGFADAGRVYLNGNSPGGWHSAVGAGFWVGVLDPGKSVNVLFTNQSKHRVITSVGFAL